jgi:hypothetical protein
MKVKLNFIKRFTLLALLPKEGDFQTMRDLRVLKESLALSADEDAAYQPQLKDGTLTWNPEVDYDKEIGITTNVLMKIREILNDMDKEGKLADPHVDIYEALM